MDTLYRSTQFEVKWEIRSHSTGLLTRFVRARVNSRRQSRFYKYLAMSPMPQGWKSCRHTLELLFPAAGWKRGQRGTAWQKTNSCVATFHPFHHGGGRGGIFPKIQFERVDDDRLEVLCEWCAHVNRRARWKCRRDCIIPRCFLEIRSNDVFAAISNRFEADETSNTRIPPFASPPYTLIVSRSYNEELCTLLLRRNFPALLS